MNALVDTLLLKDENGEGYEVSRQDYTKKLTEEFASFELVNPETQKKIAVAKVIDHVVQNTMKGLPLDPLINDNATEIIDRFNEDWKTHTERIAENKKSAGKSKEEKEKEAKEAKEKAEAEAAALKVRQDNVMEQAKAGIQTATGEFAEQVADLTKAIPASIKVVSENGGYALAFTDETSDEDAGQLFGYLTTKAAGNEFMGNIIKFWLGDLILFYNKKGIYGTAKEAGEAVNKLLPAGEQQVPSMLDQWKKTAERVPVHLRNERVQPTAYLAVANVKLPKKGEKESDAEFAVRFNKFKEERTAVLQEMKDGKILTRKDVLPKVEKLQIDNGLKQKPDEDVVPLGVYYKQFFFATIGLQYFLGIHEKDKAIYKDGDTKHTLAKEDLEALRDEAEAALTLANYTNKKDEITFKDYAEGKKVKIVKGVKAKGKDGAAVEDEEVEVKLFPPVFWDTKKKEEAEKEAAEEKEPEAQAPAEEEKEAVTA